MSLSDAHADWFQHERGITRQTLELFGVTSREDGAVVFPYGDGLEKVRRGIPSGERRFYFTPGAEPRLFAHNPGTDTAFLVEGETDCMRLAQELTFQRDVFGLPGVETWNDQMAAQLAGYDRVFVLLDNDVDYNVKDRVEACRRRIRGSLGSRYRAVRLPSDVKDVCEFFTLYDLAALREIIQTPPPVRSRFTALDLAHEPPPAPWLVAGWVCDGDVAILAGEPNVGKSWLSMGITAALATGADDFLGHKLTIDGPARVLYVDEENPVDVVYNRLRQLGVTPADSRHIRYLHRQGIRLDRHPEELLEEASAFQPRLIILDSLTRFHSQDEQSNGSMAALFNEGINPLARETGAAVLVLHHVVKSESSSSFQRVRGAGDLTANIDVGLDARWIEYGVMNVVHYKSRRGKAGQVTTVQVTDGPDGRVSLTTPSRVAPF